MCLHPIQKTQLWPYSVNMNGVKSNKNGLKLPKYCFMCQPLLFNDEEYILKENSIILLKKKNFQNYFFDLYKKWQ